MKKDKPGATPNSNKEVAIKVENLTKTFKIPLEASSGIKQKLINVLKGVKGYREFTPLNDISFEINEGDFFGIVGRNGSGKSTLLKTMAGIYVPKSGSVTVNGSLVPFIELGVGFNPELTGRENVFLNGALLGFSHDEMEGMYQEIVDFAEIEEFMDEKLKNYSSGMQVRLAFSIAIQAKGDILLLDEVLAVGDEAFQQKCFNYFEKLKSENSTVVLVTHDMGSVQRFCNKALMLESGKVKIFGEPGEVSDTYKEYNMNHNVKLEKKSVNKQQEVSEDNTSSYRLMLTLKNEADLVRFKFKYNQKENDDLYVGFSLFINGSSIAELNSKTVVSDEGALTYDLTKENLNPGSYEVTAGLFRRDNRELIATIKSRKKFIIKGFDDQRGSGMKLADTWLVGKDEKK